MTAALTPLTSSPLLGDHVPIPTLPFMTAKPPMGAAVPMPTLPDGLVISSKCVLAALAITKFVALSTALILLTVTAWDVAVNVSALSESVTELDGNTIWLPDTPDLPIRSVTAAGPERSSNDDGDH